MTSNTSKSTKQKIAKKYADINELNNTSEDFVESKEIVWSEKDIQNMNYVISMISRPQKSGPPRRRECSRTAFTLIELLISITILAVISSIGFVTYINSQIAARDGRRKQRYVSKLLDPGIPSIDR